MLHEQLGDYERPDPGEACNITQAAVWGEKQQEGCRRSETQTVCRALLPSGTSRYVPSQRLACAIVDRPPHLSLHLSYPPL